MIETLVLFGHLVVAFLIVALVLLQRGKGAEAGTGFGAGASGTVFGARGSASFFSRATAVLAALFFATSLTLAYFATRVTGTGSALEGSLIPDSDLENGIEIVAPNLETPPEVEPESFEAPPSTDTPSTDIPSTDSSDSPASGETPD